MMIMASFCELFLPPPRASSKYYGEFAYRSSGVVLAGIDHKFHGPVKAGQHRAIPADTFCFGRAARDCRVDKHYRQKKSKDSEHLKSPCTW